MKPEPGVLLALDERRPRYTGERVLLWGKNSCAALRGSIDDIEARVTSATTCPDYRPLDRLELGAAYGIRKEMYQFEELGAEVGEHGGYGWNAHLENAVAVLEGRSVLAVVTAVHPSDAFIVQSTDWRHPRNFFTQARSGDKGAHFRLGKAKVTHQDLWVAGSVDLVLFDARSGTFTGPGLERVPLFLVNGAGRKASLREAQLVAQAELFRLFHEDLHSELVETASDPLAGATDAEQLASQLSSWPSTIGAEPSDEVLEHLLVLQEAVMSEARLQDFVTGLLVHQHSGVSHEDLSGQHRFPDKLPEPGVTWKQRVLQDYEPDYTWSRICERERNFSGVLRTDYLLW